MLQSSRRTHSRFAFFAYTVLPCKILCGLLFGVLCSLLVASPPLHAEAGTDWTHFRGPTYSGTNFADWPDPEDADLDLVVSWKVPLGPAFSALAVYDGRVYTGFSDEGADWLGVFDAQTGDEVWRLRLGDETPAVSGGYGGPVATPAISEAHGMIYMVGGFHFLVAVDLDGKESWRLDLSKWGTPSPFGFGSSLILAGADDDFLIVQAPGADGTFLYGLDAATGETLWTLGSEPTQYQSPTLLRLAGEEQIVAVGAAFLYGVSPDGEVLWRHPYPTSVPSPKGRGSDTAVPLDEDRLLVKSSDSTVTALKVNQDPECSDDCSPKTEELWQSRAVAKTYAPNVVHDGVVYGFKRGLLSAIDATSGELLWGSRAPGEGFVAAADRHLVVTTKRGGLHLGRAGRDGWEELARLDLFDADSWNEPTIALGSIFVRSMSELARVEVRAGSARKADQWIDTSLVGADLPDTRFGRFVRSLREIDKADRNAAVDRFFADVESFPIVEGDWAHIVYRGPEDEAAVAGDMIGDRAEFNMTRVPGTDLFYFSGQLPRDAWVGYVIHPGLSTDGMRDPLNPRATVWPREGSAPDYVPLRYSYFTMPEATTPAWAKGQPQRAGRLVTHGVDLAGLGVEAKPPPTLRSVDIPDSSTTQRLRVYLPDGYDPERVEPYPLVYVFAGDKMVEAVDAESTLDHLLGDELPAAVVVFVDRHFHVLGADAYWAFELHRKAFFERVRPFVESEFHVGPDVSYLGFGLGGPIALRTHQVPESAAQRVAMVQPFLLDWSQPLHLGEASQVDPAKRPTLYVETSRIGIRGAYEDWDIREEQRDLVDGLRGQGWDVTLAINSCGFAWEAWKHRMGPALAFALTGKAEVPE